MRPSMTSKTGKAQIKPLGQTAVTGFGANPNAKSKGQAAETPRPTTAK